MISDLFLSQCARQMIYQSVHTSSGDYGRLPQNKNTGPCQMTIPARFIYSVLDCKYRID